MRKLTIQLTVGILTFIIGIIIASLLTSNHPYPAEIIQAPNPVVEEIKLQTDIPKGWRKVNIDRKFSLYLPPYMKRDRGRFREPLTAGGNFSGDGFILHYEYGGHIYREGCNNAAAFAYREPHPYTKVIINGKVAWLDDWDSREEFSAIDSNDWPTMMLCFPDIGDGQTKLLIEVRTPYSPKLNAVKRIFNSVEFR